MSADNGIYVLQLRDQSRVIHAQCIENLWWSTVEDKTVDEMVSTRIIEYFRKALPLTSAEARLKAFEMEDEILSDDFCPVLEYGISTLKVDKTWDEIVDEARELLPKEINILRQKVKEKPQNKEYYKDSIENLEKLL
jgi:hypothetical protein